MAIVLVVVLILSLVPASVFAGTGSSLHSDIELTETTVNGRQAIAVSWKISTGQIGIMQAAVTFAYDETVLELIDKNGDTVTIDSKQNDYTNSAQIVGDSRYTDSNALWVAKNGAYTAVSFNRAGPTAYTFSDNTEIGKCYLGYKEGKTIEDVTRKVLRMGTYSDADACAQSYILSFAYGDAYGDFNEIYYGSETGDGDDKDLASNSTFGKDFNFAKLTPSYTVPTGLTATYGNTLKDVKFSGADEGTWSWMDEKQSVGDAQAEPKTFKAKYVPKDTETYRTVENINISVTVNAKALTDVAVSDIADQKYTGSQIKPEVTVTGDDGKVLTADKDYTLTYGGNMAVGEGNGSVTVTAKAGGNYTFDSVTKFFNIVKESGKIGIHGDLNKIYNGKAVDVTNLKVYKNGSTGVVTYKFYTDKDCTTGETAAAPSNAGRYWVKAYMAADANYGSAESDALAFEISRADINPAVNIEGWTYGDTAKAPAVTGNTGEGAVTYEYKVKDAADNTYSANVPSDAGNYTVRATVAQTANYNGNTAVKDFTISPKSITEAVIAAIENETYTGNAVKPEPVVKDGENTLTKDTDFTYSYEDNTAAGTATVKITGKGNYTGEKTQRFTINRAELTYEVAAAKNIKVGSNLSVFTAIAPESATGVKNETVSGSVNWYSDEARSKVATENDVKLEVGNTVTLYWTFTPGSSNYNAVSSSVKFMIVDGDPQNISFSADAVEKTYGDAPFVNKVFNKDDNGKDITDGGEITWGSSNTAVAAVDSKTGEVTVAGAGTATITATAAKVDGKYAKGTASYKLNVAHKAVTIEGISAEDKIYDGNTAATVSGTPEIKGLIDGDVVTVITGTASFSDKNAGANKEVTFAGFELTGKDADNYQLAAQPASVKKEISKKEVTIINVKATDREYNGSVDVALTGAELAGAVTGDDVSVACGKGVVETPDADINKPVTVTGYELTGEDKANYILAGQPEGITVTIRKIVNNDIKNLVVSSKYGTTGTADLKALLKEGYKTGAISVTTDTNNIISVKPEFKDGELTYVLNEGTEDASAVITVKVVSATNYIAYDITVTVNATSKFIPALDVKDFEKTYNEKAVDIADVSKAAAADGNTIEGTWEFVGTYNLTDANAGIPVTVKFTPANEEFAAATAVITVTINKAKPSGTPEYTKITADGRTLADAELKAGTITPTGTIAWDRPADTAVEKNAKYSWTFTPDDTDNYEILKGEITPYYEAAPTPGGGGGILPPAAEKPEITVDNAQGKFELSADGTTATITPNDGYEIDKVTVNGKEVTAVDNKIAGLKTGDKVVVTFKEKTAPEPGFDVQKYVSDLKLVARSSKTAKGNVKVRVASVKDQNGKTVDLAELKDKGYTVKYKFYRSDRKASKYTAKVEKTISKNSYVNTTGKKGTKYFYKARVMVYDNDGKLVAKSALKQCKYASRTWTK